ncbi:ribonuclease HI [Vibrio sp. HN007]|uniref:ribonuclease HI n=1 Tax=Vibrio iocasae TaxID=3098914 RepID=UPI0035D3F9B6
MRAVTKAIGSDLTVNVYTYGYCCETSSTGGWGYVLVSGEHYVEKTGVQQQTTPTQIELKAAVNALEDVLVRYPDSQVIVRTDSQYVVDGINGKLSVNQLSDQTKELWTQLDELNQILDATWVFTQAQENDQEAGLSEPLDVEVA